jgi:Secretion system C-terminal sorting domain
MFRVVLTTLLMLPFLAVAQAPPPLDLVADVQEDGSVILGWDAPPAVDQLVFYEEFDDTLSGNWVPNDDQATWFTDNGRLVHSVPSGGFNHHKLFNDSLQFTQGYFETYVSHRAGSFRRDTWIGVENPFGPDISGNEISVLNGTYHIRLWQNGTYIPLWSEIGNPESDGPLGTWLKVSVVVTENGTYYMYFNDRYTHTYSIEGGPLSGGIMLGSSSVSDTNTETWWEYVRAWTGEGNADMLEYHIVRDEMLVGVTTDLTFTDELPTVGEYEYTVVAMHADSESPESNRAVITWDGNQAYLAESFDPGLPYSWTVETTLASRTWESRRGGMILEDWAVHADHPADERLISPLIDLSGADVAFLSYETEFDHGLESNHATIEVRVEDGPWEVLYTYPIESTNGMKFHDLEAYLNEEIKISWRLRSDFGFPWAQNVRWWIDNVLVSERTNNWHVEFELTPTQTLIPTDGGDVVYNAFIYATNDETIPNLRYKTWVVLPSGLRLRPTLVIPFTAYPHFNFYYAGLEQTIPAFAPGGDYEFIGEVGLFPSFTIQDTFQFTKLGEGEDIASSDLIPEMWPGDARALLSAPTEHGEYGVTERMVPGKFTQIAVYPNPFNMQATVRVHLPQTGEMRVEMYNTLGQEVTQLASDVYSAGIHDLILNASDLASGLYFVRAETAGEVHVQKVMLLR